MESLFDHENIERIYAIGYSDDEQKEFIKKIKEYHVKHDGEKANN